MIYMMNYEIISFLLHTSTIYYSLKAVFLRAIALQFFSMEIQLIVKFF